MMDVMEVVGNSTSGAGQEVDPFAFFPGISSRIIGLGGAVPGHDPSYVFHTPYVRARRGPAEFTVRISGLVATTGTLAVRIHMQPIDLSAHARLMNSERIALARLSEEGGEIRIGFEGYPGMTYAVLGTISDDTDAWAASLTVSLDQPYDPAEDELAEATGAPVVNSAGLAATSQLVSISKPTLTAPVSQIFTPEQIDEEPFQRWRHTLQIDGPSDRLLWEQIYVLEVLSRYGLLKPGARGLGFDATWSLLPAAMAKRGASVVIAGTGAEGETSALDHFRRPALCDDMTFADHVSTCSADLQAVPPELVNFDFLWSRGATASLESPAAALKFVEDRMICLSQGGIAIHLIELAAGSWPLDPVSGNVLRKGEVERIALQLISRGNEVAQIRADALAPDDRGRRGASGAVPPVTSFALIARRTAGS
ncbi:MAG: class SAM-dependent methyltransferase [Sphingomonas bacterium]|nr:class SAM-dependent methyltransferase [Sphingomonas bacterium]